MTSSRCGEDQSDLKGALGPELICSLRGWTCVGSRSINDASESWLLWKVKVCDVNLGRGAVSSLGGVRVVASKRTALKCAGEWDICFFNACTTLNGVGVAGELEWTTMGNSIGKGEEKK